MSDEIEDIIIEDASAAATDTTFAPITAPALDLTSQGASLDLTETNTYRWDGAKMTQQIGLVLPIVYGRHLMAGNLVNAYIEEGESDTLNMLIALCEGEIESISNVKINGNPIQNYYADIAGDPYGKSAEVTARFGSLTQAPINGFGDLHNYTGINMVLAKTVPVIFEGGVDDAEGFSVELEIDKLYQKDANGNMISWYHSFQIEYKPHGDSEWKFMGVYEINKMTTSSIKRIVRSDPMPPNRYDVKITKVSDDQDLLNTFGAMTLVSVDEVVTENLSYPGTALMALRLLSTAMLQEDMPNVTCVVTGRKIRIPKITYTPGGEDLVDYEDYYYDAAAERFKTYWNDAVVSWDGVTYAEAWSANPVWCLRDLLLNNRYGLGDFIKGYQIDEAAFLNAALYCEEGVPDADGHKEKRFRLDLVLDSDFKANDVIATILRSFRGMIDTSNGNIRISVERQANPVFMFTVGNIIANSLTINYLSDKIPNVISADFTDKDKDYRRDQREVGDEDSIRNGESIRQGSLQMIGCTRISQVIREARIYMNKLRANRSTITFQAYVDAILLQPNDVFEFQHELPAWGDGGRVNAGSSATLVKLDKEVIIEPGKTYELMVKNGTNDAIETRQVTGSPGAYTQVEVTEAFSFTPGEYDVWAFGVVEQSIQQYRALTVSKQVDGKVAIQGIQYTPGIYDPTTLKIPEDNYVHLSLEIPNVTNIIAVERTSRQVDGTIMSQAEVSFKKPTTLSKWVKQAVRFEVHLSDNQGKSWTKVGETDKEYFLIPDPLATGREYAIAIASISEAGERNVPSTSPKTTITIVGWMKKPGNVHDIQYTFTDEIVFTWGKVADSDLAGYEIRLLDSNWGGNDDAFVWRGMAERYVFLRPFLRSGIPFFFRAYNTHGQYSEASTVISPANYEPPKVAMRAVALFQKAFLSWDTVYDEDLQYYEVWRANTSGMTGVPGGDRQEELIGRVMGTQTVVEVPFTVSYYRVRAMDRFGGGPWSDIVAVDRVYIVAADVSDQTIKTSHLQAGIVTADKIATNAVTADKIAANSIYACHLAVDSLSALTADLGKVTSGCIVGAIFKTSEAPYRMEINQTGLYSYNTDGTLVVKLSQGEMCFINPNCNQYYTFIDAGQMKFHTPVGDIPYLKRIETGFVAAGGTVTLEQWYEQPFVQVGLKKLMSYNSAQSPSCQEWLVYADNVRYYCTSPTDFGWKFDVHAKLTVSGGMRPECIMCAPFNVSACTGVSTCQIILKEDFQYWCADMAPSNYFYGKVCFEARYRVLGSGTWCSCCYSFVQPHATIEEMKLNSRTCQTINFPCSQQWELQMNILYAEWHDSQLAYGGYICCLCCYQYSADCSYWVTCMLYASRLLCHGVGSSTGYVNCTYYDQVTFSGFTGGLVCKSDLCYSLIGSARASSSGGGVGGSVSVSGEYGAGGGMGSFNSSVLFSGCTYINTFIITTNMWACGSSGSYWYTAYQGGGTTIRCLGTLSDYGSSSLSASVNACQLLCYKRCCVCYLWCCYYYKIWSGAPAVCQGKTWFSRQEATSCECILDPGGEANYLAIAYS